MGGHKPPLVFCFVFVVFFGCRVLNIDLLLATISFACQALSVLPAKPASNFCKALSSYSQLVTLPCVFCIFV